MLSNYNSNFVHATTNDAMAQNNGWKNQNLGLLQLLHTYQADAVA